MALNKYSDLTFEEFKSQYLMESQHCSATKVGNHILSEKTLPNYVNWKDLGRVSPVKDQVLFALLSIYNFVHNYLFFKRVNVEVAGRFQLQAAWNQPLLSIKKVTHYIHYLNSN